MPRRLHHEEYPHGDAVELELIDENARKRGRAGDSTHEEDGDLQTRLRSNSESRMHTFERYSPDEEKRVVRKLDLHVVTFMSFLYLLSFLDRSNIGNARIAGLERDLSLSNSQFEWLVQSFYITYIAFEWMILLYQYLTPHVYISLCVLAWGLLASLQSVTTSFSHMLVLRLLLGVSEAAFSPGVPFYLSFFYRREELALRAGMQVSAAPLASSFAGSLAWLITKWGRHSPFAPWRLLFLVEGFPSVLVAVVAWNVIADSPGKAKFLTARERKIASQRLQKSVKHAEAKADPEAASPRPRRVDWHRIWSTVKDPKCYLTALMFLNCNISFASMPVFMPTIIKEMGHTSLTSQALSAPPYLVSFVVVIITARLSDRSRTRSPFVIFHALMSSSAYLLLALSATMNIPNFFRYMLVYPACCGFFSAITIIITWTMNNQASSEGKGVGMTILNLFGQCGPLIGVRIFPKHEAPFFGKGMAVCAVAMAGVAILAWILRVVLVRENRKSEAIERLKHALDAESEDEEAEPLAGGTAAATPIEERFILML